MYENLHESNRTVTLNQSLKQRVTCLKSTIEGNSPNIRRLSDGLVEIALEKSSSPMQTDTKGFLFLVACLDRKIPLYTEHRLLAGQKKP